MTSRLSATECYVYIALPRETAFVTAGKFVLDSDRSGVARGRFVYGRGYLERGDAVPVDPIDLKLAKNTYETTRLKGVFGALRDASPDSWGRRIIERRSGKPALGEIDYLLLGADDRAGALGFGRNARPPAPRREFNRAMNLGRLQELADAVIADEDLEGERDVAQVEDLLLLGTSMGGARPKAVVEDADALWIAKFNRTDDRWNHARVEHAMLRLARECGIDSAESRLTTVGNRDVVLVKRFDRQKGEHGYMRARMLSGLTLLRSDESHLDRDKWSYVVLAEELRRISAQPEVDGPELFRRMCFNALISNIDDHPRNHAVIARTEDWRLSPAYDLVPATPMSIERRDLAMACGDMGRVAQADNLVSQGVRFLLARDEAERIVDRMEATIGDGWRRLARREGVSEADCERIAGAFVYPGFRLAVA